MKKVIKKNFTYLGGSSAYFFKKKFIHLVLINKNYFWGISDHLVKQNTSHVDLGCLSLSTFFFKKKNVSTSAKRNIFFSNLFFFFKKFKFKGKGFKIKKSRISNALKFFFGFSHKKIIFAGRLSIKKIKKFKFVAISTLKKKILNIKNFVIVIKPLDNYTKRGLRLSRQITKKRPGKKKTY